MPTTTIVSSGRRFDSEAGETLLDAALRQGIALEHSCRTGRCSTCKSRVLSGQSVALHEELGLAAADRAEGWVLSCVRSASTDLVIEATDLGDMQLYPARTWPCRVQAIEVLAEDVLKIVLRLPPSSDFACHPGQYVDVFGPGGVRRSYSVANAIGADKLAELHVKRVEGGVFSRYWFDQAKPGDLLRLRGPQGTFFLRGAQGLDLVFLATGTGIAPVKAMLEGLAAGPAGQAGQAPRTVTVYWGGRAPDSLYMDPGLASAVTRYVPVLSRADASWQGARGHVQEKFLADAPDLGKTLVYACGSPAMIDSARAALQAAGLPPPRFHADAFVSSAAT